MDVLPGAPESDSINNATIGSDCTKLQQNLQSEHVTKSETTSPEDAAKKAAEITITATISPAIAVQSKIPLKRAPVPVVPAKAVTTARHLLQTQPQPQYHHHPQLQPQQRTASKISFSTNNDVEGKKMSITQSKSSLKTYAANILKLPAGQQTKNLSVKGTAFPKRSVSTVSSASSRKQKNDTHTNIPLPKISSSGGDSASYSLSARDRVAENNRLKIFADLQKTLSDMQSDFMVKFEGLKLSSPDKIKNDFKFITMVKNGECKLLLKDDDLLRMPKKLPAESVNDFKEKVKFAMDHSLMTLMESLKKIQEKLNTPESLLSLEETHKQLEQQQTQQLKDLNNVINGLCGAKEVEILDSQIVRMQREIQESKKAIQSAENTLAEQAKAHANEISELKNSFNADLSKKDRQIIELQKKVSFFEKVNEKLKATAEQIRTRDGSTDNSDKSKLIEELKTCKDNLHSQNKKLVQAEHQILREKEEKHEKTETIKTLETELEAAKKKIEDLRQKGKTEANQKHHALTKELKQLKACVESLETEKSELAAKVMKLKEENYRTSELENKLQVAECHAHELQLALEAKSSEERPEQKGINIEISKLRQSEIEKKREIEKLKVELAKAHYNITQLEEQIQRDQQLLEVRSELINSLQTNDNSQRIHLEEMFAQVVEKNNAINELNNELRTKSEEFRNLFTTLSTKQMELSRQEHMIKLLEESNERSQMLRVKQEEKIGRMEEEITHLKQTITFYQNDVLGNGRAQNNALFAPVTSNDDSNENMNNFTNERRRKRQVDINVKKYEA